jgi:hypothetical protein
MRVILVAVILLAVSCQVDDRPRYLSEEDHFSIAALAGWNARRELGSVVFTHPDQPDVTIAIRHAPLEAGAPDPRTARRVIDATATALLGLPGATVDGPTSLPHYDFTAARFDLTFAPPSGRGKRVIRRHVVLVAPSLRVFHVLLTAPSERRDAFEGALALFAGVVDSLREEG